jgi:sulfate adenylyltransferase subunit 2
LSHALTIDEIVDEAAAATRSERETRVIDHGANTMEDKKREGYF